MAHAAGGINAKNHINIICDLKFFNIHLKAPHIKIPQRITSAVFDFNQ
jgi:hypothetical protein